LPTSTQPTDDIAVRATALTKHYGRTHALEALDLAVRRGEVYGFLGPNGAGKTTTIRLTLGLHRPTSGTVEVFGIDAWADPVAAHRRLAYVSGEPALWPSLTVAETLEFLGRLRQGRHRDRTYEQVLLDRFQLETDRKVRSLSKGNRQKVQLVAALSAQADLLLLDEPTSGLDPLMEVAFRNTIGEAKAGGATVFLSSHILSEVESLCDRVGILRDGRLVDEGTLDQLRHLAFQTVEATFAGPPPDVSHVPGVRHVAVDGGTLRVEVSGELAPLLQALSSHDIVTLRTREPSLEEIFLHHYTGQAE
jgi:ABC-2 type transport system ATP-binding protein